VQKNVGSQKIIFFAFDSTTNTPKTGDAANITGYISKDFGAVTVLGDTSATEMDATNAKGYYLFDVTQTETNADVILGSAKSTTANIVVVGAPATIFTTPASFTSFVAQTGDSYARIGANGAGLSAVAVGTGGIAAASFAAGAIDNAAIAADAIGSSELAATAVNEIADGILARNIAGGSSAGRTVKDALSFLRNKWTIVGTTLTVYDTDDTTVLWTGTVTGTAGADPITGSDPA
jgi:hypothetical protein